jgi:ferric-dicitrate binding protein FerR (iron transport regulator)
MPTRKQRRRRAKEQRHEYEWVIEDEEGHEVQVDPAELRRAHDRAGSKGSAAVKTASQNGKPAELRDKRGRTIRPAKPPSWRRAVTRAALFAVALFVLTSLTQHSHVTTRAAIAVAYGIFGVPFFYFLDRTTYRRYLRLVERQQEEKRKR